jgi:hypothetical protein
MLDLDEDLIRKIAAYAYNPVSPKDLVSFSETCEEVRNALGKEDALFVGTGRVRGWKCVTNDLILRGTREEGNGTYPNGTYPHNLFFDCADSFDQDDFDTILFMAKHGVLAELRGFGVFSPTCNPPWHDLVKSVPSIRTLHLDMTHCSIDVPSLVDAACHGKSSSLLEVLHLEVNAWLQNADVKCVTDAIAANRFPCMKRFRADNGASSYHWERDREGEEASVWSHGPGGAGVGIQFD